MREGQLIDNEVYRQLELAGLLTNQTPVKPMAGSGFICPVHLLNYLYAL